MAPKQIAISDRPSPTDAERWIRAGEAGSVKTLIPKGQVYTTRLSVDITPDLLYRIKLSALSRHQTVAGLVRDILERQLLETPGAPL